MLNPDCRCCGEPDALCEWCDLYSAVSDGYKSLHGIRPRWMSGYSLAQLRAEALDLAQEIEESIGATRPERLMPLHGSGWVVSFAGAHDVPAARARLMAQAGIDPTAER